MKMHLMESEMQFQTKDEVALKAVSESLKIVRKLKN